MCVPIKDKIHGEHRNAKCLQSVQNAKAVGSLPSEAPRSLLAESPSLFVDLMCYSLSLVAVVFRGQIGLHGDSVARALSLRISIQNLIVGAACLILWAFLLRLSDSGREARRRTPVLFLILIIQASLSTCLVAAILVLCHPEHAERGQLAFFFLSSLILLLAARLVRNLYHFVLRPVTRKPRLGLVVGCGHRGQQLAAQLLRHPRWNYQVFGFVDPHPSSFPALALGGLRDLETLLINNPIDEVLIALPIKSMYDEIQESIAICERVGIQSRYSSDLFETSITKRRSVDQHDPSSVLLHVVHDTGLLLKRSTDLLVSAASILLLSPLLVVIAIAIKLTSEGPVLFRQQRYGLNRRLFTMYKFRSMVIDAEQQQATLEHMNETTGPNFKIAKDPRITGIGEFIRKTSLDELPQLWNVFIGDMSLVGPRPLPIRDVSRFTESWLMRRFSVPPGITGLWQVSGRSNTTFAHWITLDLEYIDRWSLLLDVQIMLKTFYVVLRREGAV